MIRDVKWKKNFVVLAILALAITFYMPTSEAQEDPYIEEVLYSKGSENSATVVLSGRDNATFYRYIILDDITEAPENWFEPNFNDTSWEFGAAPFGDREYDDIDPNTDWDTDGNSPYEDDIILVRHKFKMSGIVTSAQIDVAFANYCTPYLNGNIIYEERGANNHVQNYWNEDGTEEISPSSFLQGQNVLAVYGRDYVAGWQNRQWLDLEINANIFEPSNETIIFGDTVTVAVKGGNKGDVSAEEVIIESFTNESTISSTIFSTTEPNFEDLIFFTWTPDYIGENILNLHISCNCSDGNSTNNNLTLNITTKIYRLKTEIENNLQYVNQTRNLVKIISITNNGGLTDNVTLIPSNGEINSQLTFSPNNFILNPGESKNVTVSTQLPLSIEDGFHNISFQVKTQHDYTVSEYLVNNGITNEVAWKWIESDGYEELYSNANWTTLGFNDTDWLNASTPFGDSSVDGVNYRTLWDEDNYAYFRYILNISNVEIYKNGVMNINVASNNFGDHYINGIFVFGDLDQGNGHGAEYWNDEVQIFTNYLLEGENVIASVIGNPQNTQWFDQEIIVTFPQANLWNYEDATYNVPIFVDTTAPSTKVNENGFYKNSTNIPLTWKEISDDGDLEGYYLYYQIKDGSSLGDWMLYGYYDTILTTNFTAENGKIYRFRTIGIDVYGNKEIKGTYDTEVKIDMDLPRSELWLSEGDIQYTNLDGVTVNWKENETSDIQGYLIEYKKIDETYWENYGLFTGIGEYWFEPESDGTYQIRSRSIDYSGNKEIKEIPDITITFDRKKPLVSLNPINILRDTGDLTLSIKEKSENLSSLDIEFARLEENNEDILEWKSFDEEWLNEEFIIRNLVDGYTYYFRINPEDYAGNNYPREEFEFIFNYEDNSTKEILLPTIPLKPVMTGKIKNVEITVDENSNGIFDKILQEYNGNDLSGMKANQYWIDYDEGKLVFGNGDVGYLPPINSSISIIYSGYDLVTTIDNNPPMPVQNVKYNINDENNLTIEWNEPEDAVSYIIESRDNFSRPWEILENIDYTKNKMVYEISNLSGGFHYYRIISVDRMGYQNADMEGELLEIFIEYENINSATSAGSSSTVINNYIIVTSLLVLTAIASAAYAFRNKKEEVAINVDNSSILVPVELLNEEQINTTEEDKPTFSVVQGSQFSRTTVFVCVGGCQSEFENVNDGDDGNEIMCPHCGLIGDSPL
tara:strand:+ start:214 stop:3831 length:3618 start_codon:yes stop_codon:yes gene_type:complete